jgi:hypothetical protein
MGLVRFSKSASIWGLLLVKVRSGGWSMRKGSYVYFFGLSLLNKFSSGSSKRSLLKKLVLALDRIFTMFAELFWYFSSLESG